jgi:hypothetical protein
MQCQQHRSTGQGLQGVLECLCSLQFEMPEVGQFAVSSSLPGGVGPCAAACDILILLTSTVAAQHECVAVQGAAMHGAACVLCIWVQEHLGVSDSAA